MLTLSLNNQPTGTVTFLFTDIAGSTVLWEQHPETMRIALAEHDAIMHEAITAHGGMVFKTVGDAFCAAFTTAPDALNAAVAAQRALNAHNWGKLGTLRVRMALHTGAVEERGGDYYGPPLNRVARILSAGHGGQTLLSLAVEELVCDYLPPSITLRELGSYRLKDLMRSERIFQVVDAALASDFPPLRTLNSRPNNLPSQATSLIDRDNELTMARSLLQRPDVRLLTLTGPGGTGKTRLSLQIAAELLDDFDDGVFFVELASINNAALVVPMISRALGIYEGEHLAGNSLTPLASTVSYSAVATQLEHTPLLAQIKAYLRKKQLLLILDNFEQLVSSAPLVSDLIQDAPGVKVLVTSRTKLRLYGEQEMLVPPLALPNLKHLPCLEKLGQYAAVALFIQRAQAVNPNFSVTNENAPAVAEICTRLDGLPLAIELAAARIKLLAPEEILTRLSNPFKVLTNGARNLSARQQTLRNAIDWSYNLLESHERILFARLGVFVGGSTLDAIEYVCNAEDDLQIDVLDGVGSLIDKSLLQQSEMIGQLRCFTMLETIREYASERLAASGELEAIQRQHALYYLRIAEKAELELNTAQRGIWLNRLEMAHDNMRAALQWALNQEEPELAVRLGVTLWQFWVARGYISEGRDWLTAALERSNKLPMAVRAQALAAVGTLARHQADVNQARLFLEASLAFYRELGDKRGAAKVLCEVGWTAHIQGELSQAQTYFVESLALSQSIGDKWGMAQAQGGLGWQAHAMGDLEQAHKRFMESLTLHRELGNKSGQAWALFGLGETAHTQGDTSSAQHSLEESLTLQRDQGDKEGEAWSLTGLGKLAHTQGDLTRAQTLFDESLALHRDLGNKRGTAWALDGTAEVAYTIGNIALADALFTESIALHQQLGDTVGHASVLYKAGWLALSMNDIPRARAYFLEALALYQEIKNGAGIGSCIAGLGGVASAQGQLERTARLWGAAEIFRGGSQTALAYSNRAEEECKSAISMQLDRATWNTQYRAGREMTPEQAIGYALER